MRKHLFSPYSDHCIYCNKSSVDDAIEIENTPCQSDKPLQLERFFIRIPQPKPKQSKQPHRKHKKGN